MKYLPSIHDAGPKPDIRPMKYRSRVTLTTPTARSLEHQILEANVEGSEVRPRAGAGPRESEVRALGLPRT